jgi:ATP-dependent DNA helicase RecQ
MINKAREILKNTFGYDQFRPGQEDVVRALLDGAGVLAVMPTGSGKSLCFQIPALVKSGLTLVVSPLIALMEDQVAALQLAGVSAESINSTKSYDDNAAIWRRVASGDVNFLYIAPERLMTDRMLGAIAKLPLSMIAIDEAHCISRWGPSFRPEYEQLANLKDHFPDIPIAALTATADEATRADISGKLFRGQGQVFVSSFDRPNIRIGVDMRSSWKRQLLDFVNVRKDVSGIVYCLSRKQTEQAAQYLGENGIPALPYHAGMDAAKRSYNQDIFMTEPGTVMVATIAFGMGIDKPDVRYVFHTNLPANMESYYQEIGRAGRDGAPAEAMMLYGLDDIRMRRMFIDQDDSDDDNKRREHKRLDTLIAYCETPECRRQALLAYFGDSIAPCGNCDVCLNPPELEDGNQLARLVMDVVKDTGQCFGAAHLIDILRGADTDKIRNAGHQRLSGYGEGRDFSKDEWRSLVRQMVAAALLQLDIKGYGGLSLTQKAMEFLKGEHDFSYRKAVKTKRETAKKASRKSVPRADLSERDNGLFETLKEHRLELARERGVPAYVIFPDKTLIDMAAQRPSSRDEFAALNGVGKAKLEKFADSFLDVIGGYDG